MTPCCLCSDPCSSRLRWGHRFSSFWCCYGTAVESFAKLADTIFFRRMRCVSLELCWMHLSLRPVVNQPSARLFERNCGNQCFCFGWCSRGGSQSNVLYISRFADATLQWPSEGVMVIMSHDYLSFHDKARVSLVVQTLKHQHWEGTIQVGRKTCPHCPHCAERGTSKEASRLHLTSAAACCVVTGSQTRMGQSSIITEGHQLHCVRGPRGAAQAARAARG